MLTPRFLFVHVLTVVHALGSLVCFTMAVGSAISDQFREGLAVSGGSTIMVEFFGSETWVFLAFVSLVLAVLAYASWRMRPWAWHMTLVVYGIGVLGSLWQVSVGIPQGWIAAAVNGAVLAYAATPRVRHAYLSRR
ncbi:MAG: hypothetical protein JNM76_06980 [Betaproteobacteria bacterium]|nr:hypothetical protein [Betaproteobacteria bacterium]